MTRALQTGSTAAIVASRMGRKRFDSCDSRRDRSTRSARIDFAGPMLTVRATNDMPTVKVSKILHPSLKNSTPAWAEKVMKSSMQKNPVRK